MYERANPRLPGREAWYALAPACSRLLAEVERLAVLEALGWEGVVRGAVLDTGSR